MPALALDSKAFVLFVISDIDCLSWDPYNAAFLAKTVFELFWKTHLVFLDQI